MKPRLLVTAGHFVKEVMRHDDGIGPAVDEILAAGIEIVHFPRPKYDYSLDELRAVMPGVRAAVVGVDPWGRAQMEVSPDLRGICRFGVGYDSVNVADARSFGITVTNTRVPELSWSVAELAVAMTLAALRKVVSAGAALGRGRWMYPATGSLLRGKTVGIVGFGAIGRSYAGCLRGFEAELLAFDPYPDREAAERLGVRFCLFDELLASSDVVSLNAPNTAENRDLFNAAVFAKMKPGSVFVNTARGPMVDEDALYRALTGGPLSAAAIDVWRREPTPPDNPLLALDNLLPLPHMASDTREANLAIALCAARQAIAICRGETPINIVG